MNRNNRKKGLIGVALILAVAGVVWYQLGRSAAPQTSGAAVPARPSVKPSLTVTVTTPYATEWPIKLSAIGDVEAWQEASIGAEVNGLRLTEVNVNVGDAVRRGQVLATFSDVMVKADVAQARAFLAEAEAMLAEASANAERTRKSQAIGVISAQQISEYLTTEKAATARLESARAQLLNQQTRLEQTQLVAADDGVISARSATVGAVIAAGQELFRLIRFNRLEWRAEITSDDVARIRAGQTVSFTISGGSSVTGTVRMVAPTVDRTTRMALVYVDIPADKGLKAGMFTRGDFELGRSPVLALPQSAVIQREGFHYAFRVGADHKVIQIKVETGRRLNDQIEIINGLEPGAKVVASGVAFLADGDTVRVVDHGKKGPGSLP
jgi:RND family efflux transporter MFP subunit